MAFVKTCMRILRLPQFQSSNHVRHYTRWSHRRPKQVFTPEEYDKLETKYQENVNLILKNKKVNRDNTKNINLDNAKTLKNKALQQEKWLPKHTKPVQSEESINLTELDTKSKITLSDHNLQNPRRKKAPIYKTKKDVESESKDMLETVIDSDGNFVYSKLPDKDPTLSQVLVTVKSHNEQVKKDLVLLEGKRLIKEALEANCILKILVFSRIHDIEYLKPFLPKLGAKLYKIPYREIQMWSDLSTTPGVMGIFKTPEVEKFIPPKDNLDLTVICDNVREPGNLGAILRTVVGVGIQDVFLTKGCVDLWNTKVLRSACGAHFRVRIHRDMNWSDIKSRLEDLKGTVLIADNKIVSDNVVDQPLENLEDTILTLPLVPYYSVNFGKSGSLVLIIGGESEGISGESYRFAAESSGLRLNIPLSNNVDSLNTGTSLGIILFEIKRQFALLNFKENMNIESC